MRDGNEYPFSGIISRAVETESADGDITETEIILYTGKMDVTLATAKVGTIAQTSDYVVSIPLIKDPDGKYILPKKNDKIKINMYGDEFYLNVTLPIPSQVGGITIFASRGEF